jgi:Signal transduction histidine kinase
VVQEALTNAVKHGGGGRVTVEVGASGGAVLVTVEDYAGQAPLESDAGHPPLPAGRPAAGRTGGRCWPGRDAGTRGRLRR